MGARRMKRLRAVAVMVAASWLGDWSWALVGVKARGPVDAGNPEWNSSVLAQAYKLKGKDPRQAEAPGQSWPKSPRMPRRLDGC